MGAAGSRLSGSHPSNHQTLLPPLTAEKKTESRVKALMMWTVWLKERTKVSGEALQLWGDSIWSCVKPAPRARLERIFHS